MNHDAYPVFDVTYNYNDALNVKLINSDKKLFELISGVSVNYHGDGHCDIIVTLDNAPHAHSGEIQAEYTFMGQTYPVTLTPVGDNQYQGTFTITQDTIDQYLSLLAQNGKSLTEDGIVVLAKEDTSVPVGIAEYKQNKVIVYPNPASDRIFFTVYENKESQNCWIVSIAGQVVLTSVIYPGKNELHISHLPAGQYYLTYKDGDHLMNAGMVITR